MHHAEGLRRLTQDQALVDAVRQGPDGPAIPEKDRAMLRFAERLTLEPSRIQAEEMKQLRRIGFTDSQLLDIVQVTSYFNFVNRMAHGLGVELEKR